MKVVLVGLQTDRPIVLRNGVLRVFAETTFRKVVDTLQENDGDVDTYSPTLIVNDSNRNDILHHHHHHHNETDDTSTSDSAKVHSKLVSKWRLLVLPGGTHRAVSSCMESESFVKLLQTHVETYAGTVAACGAFAKQVLPSFGYADSLGETLFPTQNSSIVQQELGGQVWTTPGLGTAIEMALAIGEDMYGTGEATRVAKELLYRRQTWNSRACSVEVPDGPEQEYDPDVPIFLSVKTPTNTDDTKEKEGKDNNHDNDHDDESKSDPIEEGYTHTKDNNDCNDDNEDANADSYDESEHDNPRRHSSSRRRQILRNRTNRRRSYSNSNKSPQQQQQQRKKRSRVQEETKTTTETDHSESFSSEQQEGNGIHEGKEESFSKQPNRPLERISPRSAFYRIVWPVLERRGWTNSQGTRMIFTRPGRMTSTPNEDWFDTHSAILKWLEDHMVDKHKSCTFHGELLCSYYKAIGEEAKAIELSTIVAAHDAETTTATTDRSTVSATVPVATPTIPAATTTLASIDSTNDDKDNGQESIEEANEPPKDKDKEDETEKSEHSVLKITDHLFEHIVWPRLGRLKWKRRPAIKTNEPIYTPPGRHNQSTELKTPKEVLDFLLEDDEWSCNMDGLAVVDLFRNCERVRDSLQNKLPAYVELETKRRMPALSLY